MNYWQRKRNYRIRRNADGTAVYIITVDGQDVEVSAEVYKAYSKADRRERYQAERDEGLLLSLDRLSEDEVHLAYLSDQHNESAEDMAVRNIMTQQMKNALRKLTPEEQDIIRALYHEDLSVRELARRLEVYHGTIVYKRDRILRELKNYLEK